MGKSVKFAQLRNLEYIFAMWDLNYDICPISCEAKFLPARLVRRPALLGIRPAGCARLEHVRFGSTGGGAKEPWICLHIKRSPISKKTVLNNCLGVLSLPLSILSSSYSSIHLFPSLPPSLFPPSLPPFLYSHTFTPSLPSLPTIFGSYILNACGCLSTFLSGPSIILTRWVPIGLVPRSVCRSAPLSEL
jgi:hypothetical protein